MQDLNDFFYFAKVVECGGFMAAGRRLGVPKSRLSRRVAELEARLGVRLLHRTTRRLALTEVGESFYRHCEAMLAEAEAAEETIARVTAEPRGPVRVSCPEMLAKTLLAPHLPRFLAAYPQVRLLLEVTGRPVDLIEEGIDVAIRVRSRIDDSASLVARPLGISRVELVASPALVATLGQPSSPAELAGWPALTMSRPDGRGEWRLIDAVGQLYTVTLDAPRLSGDDLMVLAAAAIAGVGAAALPTLVCHEALADGRLVRLLPGYEIPGGILHAVYPGRRHLVPAVRAFVDFLTDELVPRDHPAYAPL
ncbi:DNA-binding transcriptional LysR family regulator [Crenobacter luteus]|uniref:LysR family transcriptional regulator n=1 Tax=Crenobacter luteus TaxID=1452487 RepID=A0A161SL21_9NEIS|nr:LysR substrate-binding domain-containing protein [Crenobacter luteus]KZE35090.1 LysR family transcriptional regulator [Crenobacter luteus]TCP11262.1 DNA-binding transcriptional LysR family regulator [Crenobacter luteus]